MEDEEKTFIVKNTSKLLTEINCTVTLLAKLVACGSLSETEKETIVSQGANHQQTDSLLSTIQRKHDGFIHLKTALQEDNQTGAFSILKQFAGLTKHGPVVYDKRHLLLEGDGFKVYKGRMQFRKSVAVKRVKFTMRNEEVVRREIELICRPISHPNILQCFFAEELQHKPNIIVILETWRCNLEEFIRSKQGDVDSTNLSGQFRIERGEICKQIVSGVHFLHSNNIFHGSVKPSNILIVDNIPLSSVVKMSNFGVPISNDTKLHPWLPPEILNAFQDPHTQLNHKITCKTDSFEVGMVLFFVLTDGLHPFGNNQFLQAINILLGKHELQYLKKENLNEAIFHQAIWKMLSHDHLKRPFCDEVMQNLFQVDGSFQAGREFCRGIAQSIDIQEEKHPNINEVNLKGCLTDKLVTLAKMETEFRCPSSSSTKTFEMWKTEENIKYKVNQVLAVDGDIKVFEGQTTNGKPSTVKRAKIGESYHDVALAELEKLKELGRHPNVAALLNAAVVHEKYFLFEIESCSFTLSECIRERTYPLSKPRILTNISSGLHFLHLNSIVHGRFKPSCILIMRSEKPDSMIKVSDYFFNNTKKLDQQETFWNAPEILRLQRGITQNETAGFPADIFSFGCVMYSLLTDGQHPFGSAINCQTNILESKFSLEHLSPNTWEYFYTTLITSMLPDKQLSRSSSETVFKQCANLEENQTQESLFMQGQTGSNRSSFSQVKVMELKIETLPPKTILNTFLECILMKVDSLRRDVEIFHNPENHFTHHTKALSERAKKVHEDLNAAESEGIDSTHHLSKTVKYVFEEIVAVEETLKAKVHEDGKFCENCEIQF